MNKASPMAPVKNCRNAKESTMASCRPSEMLSTKLIAAQSRHAEREVFEGLAP
jgi:hypothetical protein